MGKRVVAVKDVMFCYLLELWDIPAAVKPYRNYKAVGGVSVTSDLSAA
jgi:hypothetical protein